MCVVAVAVCCGEVGGGGGGGWGGLGPPCRCCLVFAVGLAVWPTFVPTHCCRVCGFEGGGALQRAASQQASRFLHAEFAFSATVEVSRIDAYLFRWYFSQKSAQKGGSRAPLSAKRRHAPSEPRD